MTFIDLFAGIGGFRRGLELAGHNCVGFCEWDKYARASYISMHVLTEEQRSYLATLDLKKRQKEILKDEYLNGEWCSTDIRLVTGTTIPRCDCWCFGAPCQDFSVAGLRKGMSGDRSSLIREVFRILREQKESDRPEWLIYENVKGMLSSNQGRDYLSILMEMDELGFDAEWFLFNSRYHGVPQNRERVYLIGHSRTGSSAKVFPLKGTNREDSLEGLDPQCIGGFGEKKSNGGSQFYQQDRIYDGESVGTSLSHDLTGGANYYAIKQVGRLGGCKRDNPERFRVYDPQGIAATVHTMGGGGQEPHIIVDAENAFVHDSFNNNFREDNLAGTVTPGASRWTLRTGQKVCVPVLTPDRVEKRQNGRRFKEDGEPSFTLTSQDRHGVAVEVPGPEEPNETKPGIVIVFPNGVHAFAIWYHKRQCWVVIRKLTPRECFRLQGWEDAYFDRAEFVNSDSQLYKQAGNGVTVNVVEQIGLRLAEIENIKEIG